MRASTRNAHVETIAGARRVQVRPGRPAAKLLFNAAGNAITNLPEQVSSRPGLHISTDLPPRSTSGSDDAIDLPLSLSAETVRTMLRTVCFPAESALCKKRERRERRPPCVHPFAERSLMEHKLTMLLRRPPSPGIPRLCLQHRRNHLQWNRRSLRATFHERNRSGEAR
jgi:hypothetical protein